jgi:Putative lumazine-binding
MKPILIMLTLVFCSALVRAQSAEDSIKAAVNRLFQGMKNADASLVSGSFSDGAVLQTITTDKQGKTVVRNEQVSDFSEFVSKQQKGAAEERITFETIKIDGPLAIAWTPYKFYYQGKFSHCGVNSFQLVRIDNQWKIQYLIDTRRRHGCE